jgi:hypothetical protein
MRRALEIALEMRSAEHLRRVTRGSSRNANDVRHRNLLTYFERDCEAPLWPPQTLWKI